VDRVTQTPARRALVMVIDGELHTFPITPEHPQYGNMAPVKPRT
jgi:hypothetical protein